MRTHVWSSTSSLGTAVWDAERRSHVAPEWIGPPVLLQDSLPVWRADRPERRKAWGRTLKWTTYLSQHGYDRDSEEVETAWIVERVATGRCVKRPSLDESTRMPFLVPPVNGSSLPVPSICPIYRTLVGPNAISPIDLEREKIGRSTANKSEAGGRGTTTSP